MLYRVSLVSHEESEQTLSSSWVLGVLPDFSGMRPTIVGVSCVKILLLSGPHLYPCVVRMKPMIPPVFTLFRRCRIRVFTYL